jgi:DNA adenine methylase
MEPFLKWAGGKRWLISRLVRRLPKFNRYYEPFAGSAGLFFALEPERAVLADVNEELINCYHCVRDHCSGVIQALRKLRVDENTYYRVRDRLYESGDRIARAAYFIYLNKTCWNGLYRVNQRGHFNVPMGRRDATPKVFDSDHLMLASQKLKRAKLKVADFESAVRGAKPGDLVYFDPPYITTHLKNGFIKYNSKLFHHADELRLAGVACELARKGILVIVSNAAHPLIKQMYDGPFYKHEVQRASLIAADPTRRLRFSELLISSFPIDQIG